MEDKYKRFIYLLLLTTILAKLVLFQSENSNLHLVLYFLMSFVLTWLLKNGHIKMVLGAVILVSLWILVSTRSQDLIFSSLEINNGINKLRGQSIEHGWPMLLERFYFGKLQVLGIYLVNSLSYLSPAPYFEFLPKFAVIPLFLGIYQSVKKWRDRYYPYLLVILIFSLVGGLIYPKTSYIVIFTILPWTLILICLGLKGLRKQFANILIVLTTLEILLWSLFTLIMQVGAL